MKYSPDMLINQDAKILLQLVQAAMGKGEGVSITLNSINQLNLYLDGGKITREEKAPPSEFARSGKGPKALFTKDVVVNALNSVGWSRAKACEDLKVSRGTVEKYVKKFDILPPSGQWPDARRRRLKS